MFSYCRQFIFVRLEIVIVPVNGDIISYVFSPSTQITLIMATIKWRSSRPINS